MPRRDDDWTARREDRRRRSEPIHVLNMVALRTAGRALVVARIDPARPTAPPPREAEVLIPVSEIDGSSKVKKPGDRGVLVIPHWLADDRRFPEAT